MAEQAKTNVGSIRNDLRWGLLLAAVATIGFRLPRLVRYYGSWRDSLSIGDRSGADFWRTSLTAESVALLIVLALAVAIFYALRPRAKS